MKTNQKNYPNPQPEIRYQKPLGYPHQKFKQIYHSTVDTDTNHRYSAPN